LKNKSEPVLNIEAGTGDVFEETICEYADGYLQTGKDIIPREQNGWENGIIDGRLVEAVDAFITQN
jgi:hypothetical protein